MHNHTNKNTVLLLMSGGIDSTASAAYLLENGYDVSGLYIDYGNISAEQEIMAVKKITEYFNIPLKICSLCDGKSFGIGEILGRNAFFVFTALMQAEEKISIISCGIHAGTPYYDCSQVFIKRIKDLILEYSEGRKVFYVPFANWNKAEIYKYFSSKNLPIELTYSCESGNKIPCGECNTCIDRRYLKC